MARSRVSSYSELSCSYRSSSLHDSAIVLFVICKYESLRNLKIPSGTTLKSRRDFKQFRAKFLHYDIPNLGSSFKTTDIYSDILTAKSNLFHYCLRAFFTLLKISLLIPARFFGLTLSYPKRFLYSYLFASYTCSSHLSFRLVSKIYKFQVSPNSLNMFLLNKNRASLSAYLSMIKSFNASSLRPEICRK